MLKPFCTTGIDLKTYGLSLIVGFRRLCESFRWQLETNSESAASTIPYSLAVRQQLIAPIRKGVRLIPSMRTSGGWVNAGGGEPPYILSICASPVLRSKVSPAIRFCR
jgi:hypothetical protein